MDDWRQTSSRMDDGWMLFNDTSAQFSRTFSVLISSCHNYQSGAWLMEQKL